MKLNQDGISLIKSFEGCKLKVYKDIAGVWTIGYGATGKGINEHTSDWTQEQADTRLASDLEEFSHQVVAMIEHAINDNQFSALVSFAYNLGGAALRRSRLLEYVNAKKLTEAANEFHKWNHAGGVEVPGLTRRRLAEKALFQKHQDIS